MPKDLTVKDVLYALQYGHDELVRDPSNKLGAPAKWRLARARQAVKASVADQVRACGSVQSYADRNGHAAYVWDGAA